MEVVTLREPAWSLDLAARTAADETYYERFQPIDLSGFAHGVLREEGQGPLLPSRELRDLYADSLFDLHRLLEEVRFEVAWAVMLLVDFRVRRDRGEVELHVEHRTPSGTTITMPVEMLAGLAPFTMAPPSPSAMLDSLHRQISGGRHLSRWAGAQLLDGAMLRSLSCLDRVATMLHLRADLAVEMRKDGTRWLPSFTKKELERLRPFYETKAGWHDLVTVRGNPIYGVAKMFRDGTVHHRRWPSELHGEALISYMDVGGPDDDDDDDEKPRTYKGMGAQDHLGYLMATWEEVLRPVVENGGRLLTD